MKDNILDLVKFRDKKYPKFIDYKKKDGTVIRLRVTSLSYDFELDDIRVKPEDLKKFKKWPSE